MTNSIGFYRQPPGDSSLGHHEKKQTNRAKLTALTQFNVNTLNSEQIAQLSLLETLRDQKLIEFKGFNDRDSHFFSNLNLATLALNTEYEGDSSEFAIRWIIHLLDVFQDPAFSPHLLPVNQDKLVPVLRQIEETLSWDNLAHLDPDNFFKTLSRQSIQLGQCVAGLQKGESFVMRGGYSASPAGHAMFYQFKKDLDADTYTVILYSLGDPKVSNTQTNDLQTRINPYLYFKSVTYEELFFTNDLAEAKFGLFYRLLELKYAHNFFPVETEYHFSEQDVLKAFDRISHRLCNSDHYYALFTTLQRSGNCVQKATNVLVHDLLRDTQEFKKLSLNSQLLSLVSLYHRHSAFLDQHYYQTINFQLYHGALHLCRKIHNFLKYPQSPELLPLLTRYYATSQDILSRLQHSYTSLFSHSKISLTGSPEVAKLSVNLSKQETTTLALTSLVLKSPQKPLNEGSNFHQNLSDLRTFLLLNHEYNPELSLKKIEYFFAQLPIPQIYPGDPYWKFLDKNVSNPTVVSLSQITSTYLTLLNAPIQNAKECLTVMTAIAVMHYCVWTLDSQRKNTALLKNLGLKLTFFNEVLASDHFIIQHQADWQRFQKLLAYFESIKKEEQLFNYADRCIITDPQFAAELNFYKSILDQQPELIQKLNSFVQELKHDPVIIDLKFDNSTLMALNGFWDFGIDSKFHLLSQNGYTGLACLKRVLLESWISLHSDLPKVKFSTPSLSLSWWGTFNCYALGKKLEYTPKYQPIAINTSDADPSTLEFLGKDHFKPYLSASQKSPSEGATLKDLPNLAELEQKCVSLLSANAEPAVLVSTLLFRLMDNLADLKNKNIKALVDHLLFKPCYNPVNGGVTLPLFEDLATKAVLTKEFFRKFVSAGLNQSYYGRHQAHIDWEQTFYFIEIAQKITKNTPSDFFLLYEAELLGQLDEAIKSQSPPQLIHLFKIQLYKANANFLRPISSWTQADYLSAYALWFDLQAKQHLIQLDPSFQALYDALQDHYYESQLALEKIFLHDLSFKNVLFNHLLQLLVPKDELSTFSQKFLTSPWASPTNPLVSYKADRGTFILINLLEGKIYSNNGVRGFQSSKFFLESYDNLFEKRQTYGVGFGSELYFEDELYGSCRIRQNRIERKIFGAWFSYLTPAEVDRMTNLSNSLKGGNTHWYFLDNYSKAVMVISRKKTGENRWQVTNSILSLQTKKTLEILEESDSSLANFDDCRYIHCWLDSSKKRQTIEFMRYKAAENKVLRFNLYGTRWIYERDPSYYLEESVQRPFLDGFSNFLTLSHPEGKIKILIPIQQIWSEEYHLKSWIKSSVEEGIWENQELKFSYLELRVLHDEVISDTVEGWLMLCLIYFAQKNYAKVKKALDHVTISDSMNPQIVQLFSWIINNGPQIKDYSPNACALRLQAFWLLRKLDPFTEGYGRFTDPLMKGTEHPLAEFYKIYLDGIDHIYDFLKLPTFVEKELILHLGPDNFHKRLHYLNTQERKDYFHTFQASPKVIENHNFFSKIFKCDLEIYQNPDQSLSHKILASLDSKNPQDNFLDQYEILKYGSESQRKNLIYYIQQRKKTNPCFNLPFFNDLIRFLYLFPSKAPEPIAKEASARVKIGWFYKLLESMSDAATGYSTNNSSFIQPHNFSSANFESTNSINKSPEELNNRVLPALALEFEGQKDEINFNLLAENSLEPQAIPLNTVPPLSISKSELSLQEQNYYSIIERECLLFNQILNKGLNRHQNDQQWKFKGDPTTVLEDLKLAYDHAKNQAQALEKKILTTVNQLPTDPIKSLEVQLKRFAITAQPFNVLQLIRVLLQGQKELYSKHLSQLSGNEFQALIQNLYDYMIAKTDCDHAHKIIRLLQQSQNATSSLEANNFLEEAATALSLSRQYRPYENLETLYFEYASGLRLRQDQVFLYKKILDLTFFHASAKNRHLAFQSMPGSGKSSVYLSLLMERASELGFLSVLVCHPSQMATARGNLKSFQLQRYGKNLIPVNYQPHQFKNLSVLSHLEKTFKETLQNKNQLIVDSSTVRFLQLEFLSQLKGYTQEEDQDILAQAMSKIEKLQFINLTISEKGFGGFDEMDRTLFINEQANLSQGHPQFLKNSRLYLVQKIFQLLSDPEIDQYLLLSLNEQHHHRSTDYWNIVLPKIVRQLVSIAPELHLNEDLVDPFIRYIASDIPKQHERWVLSNARQDLDSLTDPLERQNIAFLTHLHIQLAQSQNKTLVEAAHLIALVRGILGKNKILTSTLTKTYNKDYGRKPEQQEKIIPYTAVETPAQTEIAFVYEKLCYTFQSALNASIPLNAIEKYVTMMIDLATRQTRKGEKFEETVEAQEFHRLTGVNLLEAHSKENLHKIAAIVNSSSTSKLEFEAHVASSVVTSYPSLIVSTPLALVDQFQKVVGCSGTFGNLHSFNQKISLFIPDEGSEGKILLTLLNRHEDGEQKALEVSPENLKLFIEQTLGQLDAEHCYCLIDGEAALKKFSSLKVSQEILSYFKHKNHQRVQGIVFYHRQEASKAQEGREGFALLKAGEHLPIFLENTSQEEIEKYGIKIDNLFFNLDQPRATGSDLPMPLQAKGIGTASVESLRDFVQMVMRLRKYLKNQDLKIALTTSTKNILIGQSSKLIDILKTAVKNQALNKSQETFKAFKEHIPNFFRTALIKELLKMKPQKAAELYQNFAQFFETSQEDDPYNQFGFLEDLKKPSEILTDLQNYHFHLFETCHRRSPAILSDQKFLEIKQLVEIEFAELLASIPQIPELDCLFEDTQTSALGLQVQQNVQVEQKVETENQMQIDLDLANYQTAHQAHLFEEIPWNAFAIEPWNPLTIGPEISFLSSIFEDYDQKNGWLEKKGLYRRDYTDCFPVSLKITENLKMTLTEQLSVFHPLQKRAEAVLIRQTDSRAYEFILLSKKDCAFWASLSKTPPGFWVVDPDGNQIVESQSPMLKDSSLSTLEENLWYVHFFNGTVSALERRPFLSKMLFNDDKGPMSHYLQLRSASQPVQKELLGQSTLFSTEQNQSEWFNQFRFKKEEENKKQVEKLTKPHEIENVAIPLVPYLNSKQVPFLKKRSHIRSLLSHQLNDLDVEQVNDLLPYQIPYLSRPELIQALTDPILIKRVSESHASALLPAQFVHHASRIKLENDPIILQGIQDPDLLYQLNPAQIQWLLPHQIPHINPALIEHLRKPEQVQALNTKNLINSTHPSCVDFLKAEQITKLTNPTLIRLLASEQIPHLSKQGVSHLDVLSQLPYLTAHQYGWIDDKQYQILEKMKIIPANLQPLWDRINPGTIGVIKVILQAAQCLIPPNPSLDFVLNAAEQLSDKDYEKITELNIKHLKLLNLPPEFFRCTKLTRLQTFNTDLNALESTQKPFQLFFPSLKEVIFGSAKLNLFPSYLRGCHLTKLELVASRIETLPAWIGEFTELNFLYLSDNRIKEIPESIGKLVELTVLGLEGNLLASLPKEITQLTKISDLTLYANVLTELPEGLENLTTLRALAIEDNQIKALPISLATHPTLVHIYAANNQIAKIPSEYRHLKNLRTISLANNPIDEFPIALLYPPKLYSVDLEACLIKTLPPEIKEGTGLMELFLSGNPLLSLPNEIGQLPQLATLTLQGCGIRSLPDQFAHLLQLKNLNVSFNPIEVIPPNLVQLQQLYVHQTLLSHDDPTLIHYQKNQCLVSFDLSTKNWLHLTRCGEIPKELTERHLNTSSIPIDSLIQDNKLSLIQEYLAKGILDPLQEIAPKSSTILEWAIANSHEALLEDMIFKNPLLLQEMIGKRSCYQHIIEKFHDNFRLLKFILEQPFELNPEDAYSLLKILREDMDFVKKETLLKIMKSKIGPRLVSSPLGKRLQFRSEQSKSPRSKTFWQNLSAFCHSFYRFACMIFSSRIKRSWTKVTLMLQSIQKDMGRTKDEYVYLIDKITEGKLPKKEYRKIPAKVRKDLLKLSKEYYPETPLNFMYNEFKHYSSYYSPTQILTNLFLDKTLIKNSVDDVAESEKLTSQALYGTQPFIAGCVIAQAMKKLLEEKSEQNDSPINQIAKNVFLPCLVQAADWEKRSTFPHSYGEIASEIVDAINHLKPSERILIPLGNTVHYFLLQIQKKTDKEFTLKVINTGLGLEHHQKKGGMYQTFLTIVKIPEPSLTDLQAWEDLIKLRLDEKKDVTEHYRIIQKKLGVNGSQDEFSQDPLDYSTAQLQETCAASAWWSWLRHETVAALTEDGDRPYAYAEWRLLKHDLRNHIAAEYPSDTLIPSARRKIEAAVQNQLKKESHLVQLLKLTQDRELFNQTIAAAKLFLESFSADPSLKYFLATRAQDFLDFPKSGMRWQALRDLNQKIVNEITLLPSHARDRARTMLEGNQTPLFALALEELHKLHQSQEYFIQLLKNAAENKEWGLIGKSLGRLTHDVKYASLALKISKEWLLYVPDLPEKKDQENAQKKIHRNFMDYLLMSAHKQEIIFELATYFNKKGHRDKSEQFWKIYRANFYTDFHRQIALNKVSTEDMVAIENITKTKQEIFDLLIAFKDKYHLPQIRKLVHQLVVKASALDNEQFAFCRELSRTFFALEQTEIGAFIQNETFGRG